MDLLAVKAYEKNLEMLFSTDLQLPALFNGDATRIRQVLVNLVGNAINLPKQVKYLYSAQGRRQLSPRWKEIH